MKKLSSFFAPAVGVAVALLLPACSLDRSLSPPSTPIATYYRYTAHATIRSADGLERPVSFGDTVLDNSAVPPIGLYEQGDSADATDVAALVWWESYLKLKLSRGTGDVFRMQFGTGPWCLVGEATVERVAGPLVGHATDPGLPGVDPLPACGTAPPPPPQGCEVAPGMPPALAVAATSVDFGLVAVGVDSAEQPVQLTNGGTGRLCLVAGGPSGTNPDDFLLDVPPPSSADCRIDTAEETTAGRVFLEAGESCALRLRFHPAAGGSRRGVATVTSNDPGAPTTTINLTGTGQAGHLVVTDPPLVTPSDYVCMPPVGGGCYERRISVGDTGPGSVRIDSWGGDGVWSVDTFMPFTPGAVGAPGLTAGGAPLSARVRACGAAGTGRLSVAGNADNTPLTINVQAQTTPGTCTP